MLKTCILLLTIVSRKAISDHKLILKTIMRASLGGLGTVLGGCWEIFEASFGLGGSWGVLGGPWAVLRCKGRFGLIRSHRGSSSWPIFEAQKGAKMRPNFDPRRVKNDTKNEDEIKRS